jgi:dipeptidase E
MGVLPAFLSTGYDSAWPIGFVPTASSLYEDQTYINEERRRLAKLGYVTRDIGVAALSAEDIVEALETIGALYVAGGNVFYLLQELQRKDLLPVLREYISSGRPYVGASAGAVILAPSTEYVSSIDDTDEAPEIDGFEGLGVIRFSPLPHYGERESLGVYHSILERHSGESHFVLLPDDRAIITCDGVSYTVVESAVVEP